MAAVAASASLFLLGNCDRKMEVTEPKASYSTVFVVTRMLWVLNAAIRKRKRRCVGVIAETLIGMSETECMLSHKLILTTTGTTSEN